VSTVTDGVGTRTFAYDEDDLHQVSESIDGSSGGLYTKLITRKVDTSANTAGRSTGFQVGTSGDPDADYDATYAYDTKGRLNQVLGPGVDTTHGVRYERFSDSDAVQYVRYKDSNNANVVTTERYLESDRDMLDKVENRINGDPDTTVSKYDYVLDTIGRRTAVIMTGTAFDDYGNHHWAFLYNDRSELTDADRKTGTEPGSGTPFETKGVFDYLYDSIGNRTESNVDDADPAMTYTRNNVNQYTGTSDPSESFTYDDDGNFKTDAKYNYVWDAENRLIRIEPVGTPVNNDKKLEYEYDYMGRRVEKIYSKHNGTDWVVQTNRRFVYDEWNVVLLLNGASSNALIRKLTWGLDLSGLAGNGSVSGIHGAGGIGGLLAHQTSAAADWWYLYDGNGNVCQILDESNLPNVNWATSAHFEYDAYGNIIHYRGTAGGVGARMFCFSTKYLDTELAGSTVTGAVGNTGLYYYGYRYYAPRLGRWMSRDPIEENGDGLLIQDTMRDGSEAQSDASAKAQSGNAPYPNPDERRLLDPMLSASLYSYCHNTSVNSVDVLGLYELRIYLRGLYHRVIKHPSGDYWDYGPANRHPELCTFGCPGVANYLDEKDLNKPKWVDKPLYRKDKGTISCGSASRKCCHLATDSDIRSCLNCMRKRWNGTTYFLLTHNCVTFALSAMGSCCLQE